MSCLAVKIPVLKETLPCVALLQWDKNCNQQLPIHRLMNKKKKSVAVQTFEAFDYCLNGTWMNATETSCPIGTHCCGDTNTCVIPGICKTKLPSRCDRVPNGTMLCLSDTMYGICQNGALSSTNPETCPSGFVCCESRNACTSPAACKFLMPPALQSLSSVKTFIKLSPVENVCDQVSSNSMACLNPSHYTICMNGVPSTLAAQCSPSQKCCNNSCVDPKDRSCNVCAVATDFSIACISNTSFTVCLKNQMLTVPEKCPEGTVCCGNACTQPGTTLCGAL
ncbi:hypothetical protein BC830DRAFT_168080 [Chytriomyces sp. MP71]|nr:hypothetical protein BC830DRAFT_168080 [Chytriomyces sp. MP71]